VGHGLAVDRVVGIEEILAVKAFLLQTPSNKALQHMALCPSPQLSPQSRQNAAKSGPVRADCIPARFLLNPYPFPDHD
ncbi:hypothetical protein, partial [Laribacter hongkongensis]